MSKPSIEDILAPKPVARPCIYAYSIADTAHQGLLKVGQTTRDVKLRVAEQLKTAAIQNYSIELDESAERDDGTLFTDHEVRAALVKKGFENTTLEWMRCTVAGVATVLAELRTGQRFSGTHHETFGLRDEQADAVSKTFDYYLMLRSPALTRTRRKPTRSHPAPSFPRRRESKRRWFGERPLDSRLRGNDGVFDDCCVTSVTTTRSGPRMPTPHRAFCGTPRCALARPSPPTSWRRSSKPGACWY